MASVEDLPYHHSYICIKTEMKVHETIRPSMSARPSSWVRHDYANIIVKGGEVSNQEGNVTNKCFSIGSVSYWKKETWNHIFLMRPFQLQRYQCFDPQPYGVLMCFVLAWKLGTIDPHRFQVVRLGMTHHGRFVGCLILAHARGVETQTTF